MPTLALFLANAPTFVSCDASAVLRAGLSQIHQGEQHSVAFAIQALSQLRKNILQENRGIGLHMGMQVASLFLW